MKRTALEREVTASKAVADGKSAAAALDGQSGEIARHSNMVNYSLEERYIHHGLYLALINLNSITSDKYPLSMVMRLSG